MVDEKDRWVLSAEYQEVKPMKNGRARVKQGTKYGMVDGEGNISVPIIYDGIEDLCEGFAVARKQWKFGFVDANGRELCEFVYDRAAPFSEGRAAVKSGKFWGYIDANGVLVIPMMYDSADAFQGGRAFVARKGTQEYISPDGCPISESFNEPGFSSRFFDGRKIIKQGDFYGYVDESLNVVIAPKFTKALDFSEGLASVKFEGKYGYIDIDGNFVIEPRFYYASSFHHGYAPVAIEEAEWGLIDNNGNTVINFLYDNMQRYSEGCVGAKYLGKWGFLRLDGSVMIEFKYDYIEPFTGGVAKVVEGKDCFCINKSGETTLTFNIKDDENFPKFFDFPEYSAHRLYDDDGNLIDHFAEKDKFFASKNLPKAWRPQKRTYRNNQD